MPYHLKGKKNSMPYHLEDKTYAQYHFYGINVCYISFKEYKPMRQMLLDHNVGHWTGKQF